MDGVLINSEEIWERVEVVFLQQFVPQFSNEDHLDILGRSLRGVFHRLQEKFPVAMNSVQMTDFLEAYEAFGTEKVYSQTDLLPGVMTLLKRLAHKKLPMALVSSSPRVWIESTLKKHELKDFFRSIISGDEVQKSKPDPEIFLKMAQQLNILPKACLVIEDSENGIQAGKKAGMSVWGFRNGFNEMQNFEKADLVFHDFTKVLL